MFKLVIVEDEDNIRHSLECFIPWQEMGYQVVGTFSDGSDALAYLRENPCDVVLTDILMSRMSGLEMIQQLHNVQPFIKVVILSGHSDFAFAQQAIRYQVAHYLVKPVDEDELMDVFRALKVQMDAETEELASAEAETRELKQMLQKNFFRDLLTGNISAEPELTECLKLLGMEATGKDAGLLAFEIQTEQSGAAEQETSGNVAEKLLAKCLIPVDGEIHSFFFVGKPNLWQVIFVGSVAGETLRAYGNDKMQEAVGQLNESMSSTFTCHVTHNVLHLSDLLTVVKNPDTSDRTEAAGGQETVSDYRLLVLELDLGCRETLARILERMVHDLQNASAEDVQRKLKNIYAAIEQDYRKRKIDVRGITHGRFHSSRLFPAAGQEELLVSLKEDFNILCHSLKHAGHKSEHNIIDRIVRYLDENPEEDISHDAIAAKYRLHPGYLSRLFKQEMGETLSEYLLRIKIERAAQLLKEDRYKIGEIAKMVGYSTSSYFSVMFKKYTGCTPREYCQRASP